MPAVDSTTTLRPLDRLFQKVAQVKKAGEKNIPPTQHPTGSLDDGTQTPPSGPRASEHKGEVAKATQANPVDGSPLKEGDGGDKEHGLRRMMADDKPQLTPEKCSDEPMAAKLASLSTKDLLAKYASLALPATAQLLVDTAKSVAPQATPEVKSASTTPAAPPANTTEVVKAAQEGADNAFRLAQQFVQSTVAEAEFAADLLAGMTKLSIARQQELAKKAADAAVIPSGMPPAPPGGGGMPPEAALPPTMPGGGGEEGAESAGHEAAEAGAGGEGGEGGQMDQAQLEQLLLALLEQQGSADPKALEESADPAAQAMGKQARAFMKQGRFHVRGAKDAKERAAIDNMKQYIRETTR